jgi:hypothetical protein
MKSILLTLVYISLFSTGLWAQGNSEPIISEEMKIQFTPPEGWKATQKEYGYLMGSPNTPGFMTIKVQKVTSLKKLKSTMEAGIEQEDGSLLMPAGDLTMLGSQGVSGIYKGTVEGTEMTAFLMALMPPSKGRVAICVAVAPKDLFNQSNIDQLKLLMRSVVFQ